MDTNITKLLSVLEYNIYLVYLKNKQSYSEISIS